VSSNTSLIAAHDRVGVDDGSSRRRSLRAAKRLLPTCLTATPSAKSPTCAAHATPRGERARHRIGVVRLHADHRTSGRTRFT
jgi:hypothetical protein